MPPHKPFPSFKWRWLSVQPTEGLLIAPVFLGVLRALEQFEGEPYNSEHLHNELKRVKAETLTKINLARTPERNLFRNSGQYWRGTGLLESTKGKIALTNLGRALASGEITNDEFATLMVRNTVLPNPATYSEEEMRRWQDANLRIKPLEMILAVMDRLGRDYGIRKAFLTPNELIKVMIPLSGEKASVREIASSINAYRQGNLNIHDWPDCAPEANDKRLAREFLLFLKDFDICQTRGPVGGYEEKFYLGEMLAAVPSENKAVSLLEDGSVIEKEILNSRTSEIPIIIERTRVATSAIRRPNQPSFRRKVLAVAQNKCILTSEGTPEVLEAAHIVPVRRGGTDLVGNGLCMRVDIHRLYDGGRIRIFSDGTVRLHEQIAEAVSYAHLPRQIELPTSVVKENIEWRLRYL